MLAASKLTTRAAASAVARRSYTGMPFNQKVIVTCAVTGSGDTTNIHPAIPTTPKEIADACIEAAEAGAAVAHLHVRDPETGAPARELEYYREVVERVREHPTDVLINVTAGMGGDFVFNEAEPMRAGPGSDMAGWEERMEHIIALKPDICSLDCGTLNFGEGVYISTAEILRKMAAKMTELGVKPELECYEMGHVGLATQLYKEGLLADPPFYQFALGIPWGAPATAGAIQAMKADLPEGANWAAFGISRWQMPMVAQTMLLGGHVRVGLEDNLYESRGVFATNGGLTRKAIRIIEEIGGRAATAQEAREILGIRGASEAQTEPEATAA
jgi:uncharacterized protein (DUF849 family)